MASKLLPMASNQIVSASNLLAMTSKLLPMASNLIAISLELGDTSSKVAHLPKVDPFFEKFVPSFLL